MLPAAHRIRTAADFQLTTRRGVKATRGRVVVYVDSTPDPGPARIGVIASSGVGGSVVRHRVTRRIRAAVAGILGDLPCGTRIVVRALPGADGDPLLSQHVLAAVESVMRSVSAPSR